MRIVRRTDRDAYAEYHTSPLSFIFSSSEYGAYLGGRGSIQHLGWVGAKTGLPLGKSSLGGALAFLDCLKHYVFYATYLALSILDQDE